MARWLGTCKSEVLRSVPSIHRKSQACLNPSAGEAETGDILAEPVGSGLSERPHLRKTKVEGQGDGSAGKGTSH